MAKVGEMMVTNFQTEPVQRVMKPAWKIAVSRGTDYLVVTAEDEQPVSLLPADLAVLPRESRQTRLSVVPVVSEDDDLDEAVLALTPQLLEWPDLPGAVVLRRGEIRGILPRAVIARQAGNLLNVRGFTLPGNPQPPRPVFECPHHKNYQVEVVQYDSFDPPRCPYDGALLVRKA